MTGPAAPPSCWQGPTWCSYPPCSSATTPYASTRRTAGAPPPSWVRSSTTGRSPWASPPTAAPHDVRPPSHRLRGTGRQRPAPPSPWRRRGVENRLPRSGPLHSPTGGAGESVVPDGFRSGTADPVGLYAATDGHDRRDRDGQAPAGGGRPGPGRNTGCRHGPARGRSTRAGAAGRRCRLRGGGRRTGPVLWDRVRRAAAHRVRISRDVSPGWMQTVRSRSRTSTGHRSDDGTMISNAPRSSRSLTPQWPR